MNYYLSDLGIRSLSFNPTYDKILLVIGGSGIHRLAILNSIDGSVF
jgi:hypothetical protein